MSVEPTVAAPLIFGNSYTASFARNAFLSDTARTDPAAFVAVTTTRSLVLGLSHGSRSVAAVAPSVAKHWSMSTAHAYHWYA